MDLQRWQRLCERANCKLLEKVPTEDGNILLAERLVRDPADGTQVWETMWAIERADMDTAQAVRNALYQEKNGLWRSTDTPHDREDRIKETVGVAKDFIKDSRKVGRYT